MARRTACVVHARGPRTLARVGRDGHSGWACLPNRQARGTCGHPRHPGSDRGGRRVSTRRARDLRPRDRFGHRPCRGCLRACARTSFLPMGSGDVGDCGDAPPRVCGARDRRCRRPRAARSAPSPRCDFRRSRARGCFRAHRGLREPAAARGRREAIGRPSWRALRGGGARRDEPLGHSDGASSASPAAFARRASGRPRGGRDRRCASVRCLGGGWRLDAVCSTACAGHPVRCPRVRNDRGAAAARGARGDGARDPGRFGLASPPGSDTDRGVEAWSHGAARACAGGGRARGGARRGALGREPRGRHRGSRGTDDARGGQAARRAHLEAPSRGIPRCATRRRIRPVGARVRCCRARASRGLRTRGRDTARSVPRNDCIFHGIRQHTVG